MGKDNGNGNGQLVTYDQRVSTMRQWIDRSKTQISVALPRHMNADRMVRIAMTSVQRTPELLDCTPQSIVGAIVQSAQLGLEPDNVMGHAYLVPFWNAKKSQKEVQFIAGYKGLIDLARRSGQVSTIYAYVVRDGDHFEYSLGLNPDIKHTPGSGNLDKGITHVYAVCRLKDGGVQFEVMTHAEIEQIRTRSKAGARGPWVTDWAEMGKKTVLRRLCKMLPFSVELTRAVALDEHAEIGLPQDLGAIFEGEIVEQPSGLDALTQEMQEPVVNTVVQKFGDSIATITDPDEIDLLYNEQITSHLGELSVEDAKTAEQWRRDAKKRLAAGKQTQKEIV